MSSLSAWSRCATTPPVPLPPCLTPVSLLFSQYKVYYALWLGLFVCFGSLAATIWCFFLDRNAEAKILANQRAKGAETGLPEPEKEEIDLFAVKRFPVRARPAGAAVFSVSVGSCCGSWCCDCNNSCR